MKLSISNIAWDEQCDTKMYHHLSQSGFDGIEIAPTRIFKYSPYEQLQEASLFSEMLNKQYHLQISSIQSIWFGRIESIFNGEEELQVLIEYTKKAIDFASVLNCKNLVFGCPKNRIIQNEKQYETAIDFFYKISQYAFIKNTVIALEANPAIYGTNFINTTDEAIAFVKKVSCKGFRINLDLGTMLYNNENIEMIEENIDLVNHIHISEPNLLPITHHIEHRKLSDILKRTQYSKYVSIEMKNSNNFKQTIEILKYVKEVFT